MSNLIFAVQMTAAITTFILLATCVAGALRWEYQKSLSKTTARRLQPAAPARFPRRLGTKLPRFTAEPDRCWTCGQLMGS